MRRIKALSLRLDDELHKQFKMLAVERGKTMHEILIELIKLEIKKSKQK